MCGVSEVVLISSLEFLLCPTITSILFNNPFISSRLLEVISAITAPGEYLYMTALSGSRLLSLR